MRSALLHPDHDMELVFEAKKQELLQRFPTAHPRPQGTTLPLAHSEKKILKVTTTLLSAAPFSGVHT